MPPEAPKGPSCGWSLWPRASTVSGEGLFWAEGLRACGSCPCLRPCLIPTHSHTRHALTTHRSPASLSHTARPIQNHAHIHDTHIHTQHPPPGDPQPQTGWFWGGPGWAPDSWRGEESHSWETCSAGYTWQERANPCGNSADTAMKGGAVHFHPFSSCAFRARFLSLARGD